MIDLNDWDTINNSTWIFRHFEPGHLNGSTSLIPTIVPIYLQKRWNISAYAVSSGLHISHQKSSAYQASWKLPALTRFLGLKHHTKSHANRELSSINRFSVFGQWNNKIWWTCPADNTLNKKLVPKLHFKMIHIRWENEHI
jgi:hypothetical protein